MIRLREMRSRRAKSVTSPPAWLSPAMLALCCCAAIRANCGEMGCEEGSLGGSGVEEAEWWLENFTNRTNFTELCTGMIDINSSEPIYSYPENRTDGNYSSSPCSDLYEQNYCHIHNFTTLTTDSISYVNAQSRIVATVEPNATEGHSKLYYKLCYSTFGTFDDSEVIECVSNGTTMVSEYQWKKSGEAVLTILVYTSSSFNDSDYLDCGATQVTVAVDYGLNLTVELVNEPFLIDDSTEPAGNVESESEEEEDNAYIVGNMTFVTLTSLTSEEDDQATYYFKYMVSGPSSNDVTFSRHANLTGEYPEIGHYQYTIHAIAKLNDIQAHHANTSGHFWLLDGVSDTVMQVGNNNSVKVGSKEELLITAEGSTPITVCWYQTKLQVQQALNITPPVHPPDGPIPPLPPNGPGPPLPPKNPHDNKTWTPIESCVTLNDNITVFRELRTFNVVGTFQFVAHFSNRVSVAKKNFTFHVLSGPSPGVVASSATAVVVFAVLVALIVIIIALVAGGYIPYRRYKNRMTETADFRFVDLSETASHWDRLKLKANQFRDYFRKKRHNEKIGLVNLGSDPMPEERRLFYGTNTLTQFAPYETL